LADLIPPVAEAFLKDEITIGHALLIAKLQASQQQEAFAAAFRGMWTSEGNSQVLIPVREFALCGAPHKANWTKPLRGKNQVDVPFVNPEIHLSLTPRLVPE
jgi:hypothetical protein